MMQAHATTRQAGNVAVVDLSGSITVAGGTGLLRSTIKELVAARPQEYFIEPSRSQVFGQRRHGRTRGSLRHAAESGWRSEAGASTTTYHEPAAHDQALHDICNFCR